MHDIVPEAHTTLARRFRQALSVYQHNRDLIAIGAYQKGSDPRVDAAITLWPEMQKFLAQDMHERVEYRASLAALDAVMSGAR